MCAFCVGGGEEMWLCDRPGGSGRSRPAPRATQRFESRRPTVVPPWPGAVIPLPEGQTWRPDLRPAPRPVEPVVVRSVPLPHQEECAHQTAPRKTGGSGVGANPTVARRQGAGPVPVRFGWRTPVASGPGDGSGPVSRRSPQIAGKSGSIVPVGKSVATSVPAVERQPLASPPRRFPAPAREREIPTAPAIAAIPPPGPVPTAARGPIGGTVHSLRDRRSQSHAAFHKSAGMCL